MHLRAITTKHARRGRAMRCQDPQCVRALVLFARRQLKELQGRELCCYSISAKNLNNIDITMEWLVKHAKKPST
jgi:hypothetical protein